MAEYFRTDNWLESFIATTRDVIVRPGELFAGMPRAEGYGPSLGLLTITLAVPLVVYALGTMGMALLAAPLVWLMVVASTWLWAWYLGWAVRVFAKGSLDTVNAFQLCAYANVPMIFSWIPLFGVVVSVWSLALEWIGLTRVAGVSGGAALLILLVPALLLGFSFALLVVLLGVFAAQHGMQMPAMPELM